MVGGRANGKKQFVIEQLGYREDQIASAQLDDRPVLSDLHKLIESDEQIDSLFPLLLTKEVVICDEVGCGVVPVDPVERKWRDAVGRLSAKLAQEATEVFRVQVGLATKLKGF